MCRIIDIACHFCYNKGRDSSFSSFGRRRGSLGMTAPASKGIRGYFPRAPLFSTMKLTLGLLLVYMAVDAGLTTIGLNLGLQEGNPYALAGFAPHILIVMLSLAAQRVEEYLGLKHITHTAISLLAGFYGFVLTHNLYMIWRCV